MENLEISGNANMPTVKLDAQTGVLVLKGKSILENAFEFYTPIVNWLVEYAKNPQAKTVLNVQLEYFNTSSSKWILNMFKKLEAIFKTNADVEIYWYYDAEDSDMFEAGENYQSIVNLPFQMIVNN